MDWLRPLFERWTWTMARREARRSGRRLLPFVAAMSIGVAALVAIGSFDANLRGAVDRQSRGMLGADLRIRARGAFTPAAEELIQRRLIDQLGAEESRQLSFSSMAWFPRAAGSRLVQVRAIAGGYPFYGTLETDPPGAMAVFRAGRRALVDAALLGQFAVGPGDVIRVGAVEYEIAGALLRIPGESASAALLGPRVYLPLAELDQDLLARGSRISYQSYFRLPADVDPVALKEELEEFADRERLRIDTVASSQERMQDAISNLTGFLNLVGFVALLLGGLGVGSAVHVYVRRKTETVATLRCLGATAHATFAVYLAQALVLGVLGAVFGALLGLGVQHALPRVLGDFLPVEIEVAIAWPAVLTGMAVALFLTLAFTLLPLLPVRRIPPLAALRTSFEPERWSRDPARLVLGVLLALGILGFAAGQTDDFEDAIAYTAGLGGAFLLLAATGRLLRRGVRRWFPRRLPYEWRQGLSNLDRPHNQTGLLMVSIGLATFLVATLLQLRTLLLNEVSLATAGERPNVVLIDVQDDQVDAVAALVEEHGLPVLERVPMVTMRLKEVAGQDVGELLAADDPGPSRWALRREYRSTYRSELTDLEQVTAGTWIGIADDPAVLVPVSLERDLADDLEVAIGDVLVWDVQGRSLPTRVASLREVDWRALRPNFFAVFPAGVLEDAPKFHVVVTRGDTPAARGELQRDVVAAFPNVSVVDVTMILQVVDDLLERVGFAIRFMALFSVVTGLLVLVCSVLTTRVQRVEESVLLRTLGATRRQVQRIVFAEYLLLGALATATGLLLSIAGTYGLARLQFDVPFAVAWTPLAVAFIVITLLTVLVGRAGSRGIHARPPMEVLRAEG